MKILYAEDDPSMQEMVSAILRSADFSVKTVNDGNAALEEIKNETPDLVLLDYRMGEPNGFEVCRRIKQDQRFGHLPVLMLTAESRIEDRIEGFESGANDYLPKPFDARELLARVRALLKLSEQGKELNPTTGLPGGGAIDREFERRRKAAKPFTLCYLDLDYFKPFNDKFGFPVANELIEGLGEELRKLVAESEGFAGHIGGDDFVIICEPGNARASVERIQEAFNRKLEPLVPAEVVSRGSYQGKLRDGEISEVPLTRVGAALLHLDGSDVPALDDLGDAVADAKAAAKAEKESGIVEVEWSAAP